MTRVEALVRWDHPTKGLLSPRQFTLEITESVLITDIEAMSGRLRELKGLGVLLAIDDFGTGYSSLSYLRRSRSTCSRSTRRSSTASAQGREDTALAHAIVKLSHALQLHTVAEGIEVSEQPAHLASLPPGRPGLAVRPAAGDRGHDRAAGQVPGRRRLLPARGPAAGVAVRVG